MITDSSVEINAPAPVVWRVFSEVTRWSEWTPSVDCIVALDDEAIGPGNRFEIKQPRFPRLVWEVTEVVPGRSWSWRQQSLGATTIALHEVTTQPDGRTLVRQRIDQRGPIGVLVGVLTKRITVRYLELEAQGLKARSEEQHSDEVSR